MTWILQSETSLTEDPPAEGAVATISVELGRRLGTGLTRGHARAGLSPRRGTSLNT